MYTIVPPFLLSGREPSSCESPSTDLMACRYRLLTGLPRRSDADSIMPHECRVFFFFFFFFTADQNTIRSMENRPGAQDRNGQGDYSSPLYPCAWQEKLLHSVVTNSCLWTSRCCKRGSARTILNKLAVHDLEDDAERLSRGWPTPHSCPRTHVVGFVASRWLGHGRRARPPATSQAPDAESFRSEPWFATVHLLRGLFDGKGLSGHNLRCSRHHPIWHLTTLTVWAQSQGRVTLTAYSPINQLPGRVSDRIRMAVMWVGFSA